MKNYDFNFTPPHCDVTGTFTLDLEYIYYKDTKIHKV